MTSIQGDFYSTKSSRQQASVLTIHSDGRIDIQNEQQQSLLNRIVLFSELEISPRLGNTPRYLNLNNGDRFETLDNDGVDELLNRFQQGVLYRMVHKMESHLVFVLLGAVFTALAMWGFFKYGAPATASFIAHLLPENTNQYIGQGSLRILDESVFEDSELEPQRQQQLTALFNRYAEPYARYSVKVSFRKSDDIGANAMALPDGNIVFTDQMVALAQQDEELIAVFGHEIGHLVHQHVLRRVIQDSMLTVVLVLVTGDVSSVSSIITAIPAMLLELSYSRKFEEEADDFAYDFLLENNLSPTHFAHIMQRLEDDRRDDVVRDQMEKGGGADADFSAYISTHPVTSQRIKRFLQATE